MKNNRNKPRRGDGTSSLNARRYSVVWYNVPAFVGLSFGLSVGMFRWLNKSAYKVNYVFGSGFVVAFLETVAFSL